MAASADPAAQLVELGDAEPVGVEQHHRGRVGHVDTDLDDRGRHQHVDLPGGVGAHRRLLLLRRHPAVQLGDAEAGQRSFRELDDDLLDRGQRHLLPLHLLALGVEIGLVGLALLELVAADPRADDVRLVPLLDLLAHPLPDPTDPGGVVEEVDDVGLDRRAPGRQLGQRGDLEVAEHGHRDGARDRGRGHHEHVGRLAGLVGEGRTLLDAEAVLLVDDDQAEVGEGHVLLEQRVGADHDAGLAARDVEQRLPALALGHRTGQQGDRGGNVGATEHAARGQVAEHRGDRAQVLLREHLGRRQQGRLAARVDRAQHRPESHHRLAGADLSLEEPVHRVRLSQVVRDLRRRSRAVRR